jgi:hypothetical protein
MIVGLPLMPGIMAPVSGVHCSQAVSVEGAALAARLTA